MRNSSFFLCLICLSVTYTLKYQVDAAPAGPLIKHLSSLLKWTRPISKSPHSDGNVVQFENGYLVETVVEGSEIGVIPYRIRVSEDGELYAVDEVNSNIVKITPPLSRYSRGRLVAGSFQGYTGHVDGKPSDARFNHPKGVTMDDKGNVYVADTLNFAIRKIGDSGVTTIAGGKSNVVGYRDGPSEDAKFSNDFDVVYIRPTCSLLVIDRGNAALRQISLDEEDCDYQHSTISFNDVLMVVGAVLLGYSTCLLHQGYGSSFFSRRPELVEDVIKEEPREGKPARIAEKTKEEPEPAWPSFGQLILDLSKLALEALGGMFLYFVPSRLRPGRSRKGLTPLKDSLQMPDDEAEPPVVRRQRAPALLSETRLVQKLPEQNLEMKPQKIKSMSFKESSLSSKHSSSRQQEYAEFYGQNEVPPPYSKSKSHKERTRHRQRDKSGEVVYGAEQKQAEMKAVDFEKQRFEHYNMRNKYHSDASFRF